MFFDLLTMYMICNKIKTETRRLYNPDRRPAIPGSKHRIKIDRTKNTYGQIEILSCEPQRFGDMTEADALNEGFNNLAEYKKYFYQVNGCITDDELIWVVKFKPLWTNQEGVILD